jgi:microcystin degradation protein MlrC
MPYIVLSAEFFTENNTFKKGLTELRDFRSDTLALGSAAIDLRGSAENTELAGFIAAAKELGWTLKHTVSATAAPAGPVSREAFEHIAGIICDAARAQRGKLDGILLGLHGAQVVEFCEDGEGEILRRLRQIVGPDLPIAVTLDLHANATQTMVDLAQIWVSYKTYPHVDIRFAGHRAAHLLHAAMAGQTRPATLRRAPPMLEEATSGRSDTGPMVAAYARARTEEKEPGILTVSLNAGFAEADIRDAGPSVLVTFDRAVPGADVRASEIADAHARAIWAARHISGNDYLTVEEAAHIARDFDPGRGPLVIADYADNPGAGAYGDATNLLRALLDAGVTNAAFAPMVDPALAEELHLHREGEVVTVDLGGKNDPGFGGGPLRLSGKIMKLSDGAFRGDGPMLGGLQRTYGTTAVLRVDGIDILVVTEPEQVLDRQQLAAFGIMPLEKSVLALKSMQHFRAAFEPIAGKVIVCDSGALATPDLTRKPYSKVRRPVWPLDPETVYSGEGS